jgi:hypothetical protein
MRTGLLISIDLFIGSLSLKLFKCWALGSSGFFLNAASWTGSEPGTGRGEWKFLDCEEGMRYHEAGLGATHRVRVGSNL